MLAPPSPAVTGTVKAVSDRLEAPVLGLVVAGWILTPTGQRGAPAGYVVHRSSTVTPVLSAMLPFWAVSFNEMAQRRLPTQTMAGVNHRTSLPEHTDEAAYSGYLQELSQHLRWAVEPLSESFYAYLGIGGYVDPWGIPMSCFASHRPLELDLTDFLRDTMTVLDGVHAELLSTYGMCPRLPLDRIVDRYRRRLRQ